MNGVNYDFDRLSEIARANPELFARERESLLRLLFEQNQDIQESEVFQNWIDSDRYARGLGMPASEHALAMALESVAMLSIAIRRLQQRLDSLVTSNQAGQSVSTENCFSRRTNE